MAITRKTRITLLITCQRGSIVLSSSAHGTPMLITLITLIALIPCLLAALRLARHRPLLGLPCKTQTQVASTAEGVKEHLQGQDEEGIEREAREREESMFM